MLSRIGFPQSRINRIFFVQVTLKGEEVTKKNDGIKSSTPPFKVKFRGHIREAVVVVT